MSLKSAADVMAVAARDLSLGELSEADIKSFSPIVAELLKGYDFVSQAHVDVPNTVTAERTYWLPNAEDNRNNAWSLKCAIRERSEGRLAGHRIAVKDSIMIGGLPMLNGSLELQGYTARIDATVVRRILEAGGEIIGKTHCEYFCLSGGSHTNAYVRVHNPYRTGYTPGGSSTGSAAAVAGGEVTMALGADQAGSIRIPASFSGIVGMKPTYSLVPYTGVTPMDPFIDHVGPMTATVTENALLLGVVAGNDEFDPRQKKVAPADYAMQLCDGVSGLRVGVLKEGFGHANSEPDVDSKVLAAADVLARLGAMVEEISLPSHLTAPAIWTAIAVDGLTHTLTVGNGFGLGRSDLYPSDLMAHLHATRSARNTLPPNIQIMLLAGALANLKVGYSLYGKGINLARQLRAEYDTALAKYDVLLLPTTPMKATAIPEEPIDVALHWQRACEMLANTCPFNITHHPAISVPCGMSDGLPVGMMLVGRHFDERTLYRIAYAFESSAPWATR